VPITLVVGRIALHGLRTLTQQQLVGPNTTSTVAIRNVRFTSTPVGREGNFDRHPGVSGTPGADVSR
jgi:hypothetical protein